MITITGKAIKDAQTGVAKNGDNFIRFTLVCNSEKWKDKNTGENREKATFINFYKFSKDEQKVAEWIKKGAIITVNAKQLEAKLFDKNDGNGVSANIEASIENLKIEMFAPKKEQQQKQEREQKAEIFPIHSENDNDLPF